MTNEEWRVKIALEICDSEAFMWLMAGSNYPNAHLNALHSAYRAYCEHAGGYSNWNERG